jgi:CMP-N,N'-diacetyllegionaminic acid synthase
MAKLLSVIPARGGSKGLPGKNIRPLAGLPLIAHSILLARSCPEIDRVIVSTDSEEIAAVARKYGCDVPFARPAEHASDDAPLWPVLRHALEMAEQIDGVKYDYLQLLDPTAPARLPSDVANAYQRLKENPSADGIIFVSRPEFSPIWHCVIEREGWMADLFPEAANVHRRQDVPVVYRIISTMNIWRAEFVRAQEVTWRGNGNFLMAEIPDVQALDIDDIHGFERAEALIRAGLVRLPWLKGEIVAG